MATEAGPGKLRAGGRTLKELESGTAAWEQGRPCSAHCQLLSRALCCIEKGRSVARAPCGHASHSCRAPHSGTPTSAHPLYPPPLHHSALALAASSSLGSHGSFLPYPGDPTFPPISGALPAQGFSWDVEEEEGSRDSVCLLAPVRAAHQGQCTLLQPARRSGAGKEEVANPKLPWMVQEEATQNLNPWNSLPDAGPALFWPQQPGSKCQPLSS